MAKEQVSSILRALQILECFADNRTEWTLKTLVNHLNLPTTTVYRQVSTLTERQYLVQDPVRKSYQIGPRLLQLSSAVVGQSDLRRIARPELEKLSAAVRETINLSALLERDIYYLDKVETHRSIVCNTQVGTRAPAYATSCGKVLLACQDRAYLESYFHWMAQEAHPLTGRTITDPQQLQTQLQKVRLDGYAIDDGEIEVGLICFGAPVYNADCRTVAAISVSGPDYRMREDQDLMISALKHTAENISRLLGYRKDTP